MVNVLNVNALSKSYLMTGNKKVLDNVSMTVEKGQCVCIVGPNGTGKSTLLKIIAGLITKNSGDVEVNGNIGYVPEVSINFTQLNLIENIDFYRSISMNPPVNTPYADLFNLPQKGKRLKHFSKGMKRKFDLLRALNINPDLCIMDEPFEGLDPLTCREMIDLLIDQKQKGLSIIMSSHDMSYVEKLADQVLLLRNGKLNSVNGWKERRVTLIIDISPEKVKELALGKEYRIREVKGMTKLTILLKDYASIYDLMERNGGHILREENSSLEDIYLENLEE